jgi:hypothetical protein
MPGPILRIAAKEEGILDTGTTLGELREIYPRCYVVSGNYTHVLSGFALQDDVTYDLRLPTNNVGKDSLLVCFVVSSHQSTTE